MSYYEADLRFSRNGLNDFEKKNIRSIQNNMQQIQEKTFTRWINNHLKKTSNLEVKDLFADLQNGRVLHSLLSSLTGEKLPKLCTGHLRIHMLENVQISLNYLKSKKFTLQNIGAGDVVDSNRNIILGLIWKIILSFQVTQQDILLDWARIKTKSYTEVKIDDLCSSWENGLAFNALIHSHRPDLINFQTLLQKSKRESLQHAFDVADNVLNIPALLDADDFEHPFDRKSMIVYLSQMYETFEKLPKTRYTVNF